MVGASGMRAINNLIAAFFNDHVVLFGKIISRKA
jgi:hypothetical protein